MRLYTDKGVVLQDRTYMCIYGLANIKIGHHSAAPKSIRWVRSFYRTSALTFSVTYLSFWRAFEALFCVYVVSVTILSRGKWLRIVILLYARRINANTFAINGKTLKISYHFNSLWPWLKCKRRKVKKEIPHISLSFAVT